MRVGLLSLVALLPLLAESTPPVTLLATPGKILLDDSFTPESWKANWHSSKGEMQIIDGHLRAAERPADMHHTAASWKGPVHDLVARFRFRLDGSPWLALSFTDKEHVARVFIRQDRFEIAKMSGMGPTTKTVILAKRAMTFDPQKWYTATVEICGNDLVARIDEGEPLYGHHEGLDVDKARVVLISGKQFAWFDDVTIWQATRHPEWDKTKTTLAK